MERSTMYGIFINRATEPYVHVRDLEEANEYATLNEYLGHEVGIGVYDPVCTMCDQEIPGWHMIERDGDPIDPQLHEGACMGEALEWAWADNYE